MTLIEPTSRKAPPNSRAMASAVASAWTLCVVIAALALAWSGVR